MANKLDSSLDQAETIASDLSFDPVHAFTVDVEEWFQVGAFERTIRREDWPRLESRVEYQTYKILSFLDAQKIKATFFCLGWVAERHPLLIHAIHSAGHEVGCHGMDHERLFRFERAAFRQDIRKAKHLLEDAMGAEVLGYRAPSFSLTSDVWWVYDELLAAGFLYSSSLYPLQTDHYGMPDAPRRPFWPLGKGRILEIPMTIWKTPVRALPASGGGYFRLLPFNIGQGLFERGSRQTGTPGIFYMHPWEMDPNQPYRADAPWLSRFRHYTGQRALPAKLARLVKAHRWQKLSDAVVKPVWAHLEASGS